MNNLELAKSYYDGDDDKKVKQDLDMCEHYLQKALEDEPENPEIFYYFGLLYSENDDFEDFNKAISNYIKSYKLGFKESAINIAMLYESNSGVGIQNSVESLKWYLISNENTFLKSINKLIDKIYKHFSNSKVNIQRGISIFKNLIHSTSNQSILKLLYAKVDLLIDEFVNKRCVHLVELEDIESAICDLDKYKKNPTARDKICDLKKARNDLLINSIKNINDALKILRKNYEYEFDYKESNLIYKFLITSYLNGINGAPCDFEKAMEYREQYKGQAPFINDFIIKKITISIDENKLDVARYYCSYLPDTLKMHYQNFIGKKEEKNIFEETCRLASSGDETSMLKVAHMYEYGTGTERNEEAALELYAATFKKSLKVSALEGAVRCSHSYKDSTPVLDELFELADKENVILSSSLIVTKKQLFAPIMKYGDEKIKLSDLSYYSCDEFNEAPGDLIYRLSEALKEKGITKLVHFTSKENISSILKNGILSRVAIFNNGSIKEFRITDANRMEGNLNAISVSITRPNEYMLEQKVKEGTLIDPFIIEIDASILLNKNMRFIFCSSNAAKLNNIYKGSTYRDFLKMFPWMYTTKDGITYNRKELNRESNEPTDVQAEILVESSIPTQYIIGNPISWEQWKKINLRNKGRSYGTKNDFYFF